MLTHLGVLGQELDPVMFGDEVRDVLQAAHRACYETLQTAARLGPLEGIQVVLEAHHRGSIDHGALEDGLVKLRSACSERCKCAEYPTKAITSYEPCHNRNASYTNTT